MSNLLSLEDRARAVLDPAAFAYVAGGADEELTLADNVAAWNRYRFRPHTLRDVSAVDLTTTVLGQPIAAPFLVAPTAYHQLAHPQGEAATVRGVARAGSIMIVSTMATQSMEAVAAAAPNSVRWFQLYVHSDRELTTALLRRAEAAGYRALVLTVDVPRLGRRLRNGPDGFSLPPGVEAANLVGRDHRNLAAYAAESFDASLTFEAVEWLRGQTNLPVVVKGVLRGDDATACVDAGAAAIVVSNHGGRQLDGAIATADALPEVVAAVAGRAEVYVDGGIRRGTDVLRALALGARAVLLGRSVLWGLALDGDEGVRNVLVEFATETEAAFALAGVASCAEVTPDLVVAR
jgi:4-hydroxymandelate oxidase